MTDGMLDFGSNVMGNAPTTDVITVVDIIQCSELLSFMQMEKKQLHYNHLKTLKIL